MPLVSVMRFAVAGGGPPSGTGLQSGATLTLPAAPPNSVEVGFDLTTWTGAQAGVAYTIFSFTNPISGNVSSLYANAADLTALGFSSANFALVGSNQITVTFSV